MNKHMALLWRFIKFGLVGVSGVFVNLGIYAMLTRMMALGGTLLEKNFSYGVSVEISILTNFLLNDLWTFADRRKESRGLARLAKFHLVSLVGFAVNWGVFASINYILEAKGTELLGELVLFGHSFGNVDDLVAACIGIGAAMFWNFFANLVWTWREERK